MKKSTIKLIGFIIMIVLSFAAGSVTPFPWALLLGGVIGITTSLVGQGLADRFGT